MPDAAILARLIWFLLAGLALFLVIGVLALSASHLCEDWQILHSYALTARF